MSDLTDRMRTCAAHVLASDAHEYADEIGRVLRDAAALLIEASDALDTAPAPLGEPMEVIPPITQQRSPASAESMQGTWITAGETLPVANPSRSPRTCPKCDSRAQKTIRRRGTKLMLTCPVCATTWEYKQ